MDGYAVNKLIDLQDPLEARCARRPNCDPRTSVATSGNPEGCRSGHETHSHGLDNGKNNLR
jgi:hypothetical protein